MNLDDKSLEKFEDVSAFVAQMIYFFNILDDITYNHFASAIDEPVKSIKTKRMWMLSQTNPALFVARYNTEAALLYATYNS
jgi:hypothetical protein